MRNRRQTLAALAGMALLVAPAVGLGIFHVWSRTQVYLAGYDLANLDADHRKLLEERDRLYLEVATLRSPGRLERYAREQLGMAPPAPGTVVAGMVGGKVVVGGVVDGADRRPGPAEPVVRSAGRTGDGRAARRPAH
ncbi:MAG TPA: cell division protein FtsL [Anaeromyxobacteraceae bacterium]|nr:cell division protein FtsL [Anaeromyxobacteraceae bacterium]